MMALTLQADSCFSFLECWHYRCVPQHLGYRFFNIKCFSLLSPFLVQTLTQVLHFTILVSYIFHNLVKIVSSIFSHISAFKNVVVFRFLNEDSLKFLFLCWLLRFVFDHQILFILIEA